MLCKELKCLENSSPKRKISTLVPDHISLSKPSTADLFSPPSVSKLVEHVQDNPLNLSMDKYHTEASDIVSGNSVQPNVHI